MPKMKAPDSGVKVRMYRQGHGDCFLLAFRDDVLDELTQLYFERKRVILQRAALQPTSAQARQLQLRAEELAAGMDAWTGGWFSRAIGLPPP